MINWATTYRRSRPRRAKCSERTSKVRQAAQQPQLVLKWSQPDGVILSELARWPVMDPAQWVHLNAKQAANYQNTKPIGSGPFEVVSYTPKQTLLAKRNPYWPGPQPKIHEFGLQQFTNDDAMLRRCVRAGLTPWSRFRRRTSAP